MVENVSPAIVGITNYQTQSQTAAGFGDVNTPFDESQQNQNSSQSRKRYRIRVIFKKSGSKAYVLTNNHVIEGANKLTVSLHNGKTVAGKVVGSDPLTDLAVVEISSSGVTKSLNLRLLIPSCGRNRHRDRKPAWRRFIKNRDARNCQRCRSNRLYEYISWREQH